MVRRGHRRPPNRRSCGAEGLQLDVTGVLLRLLRWRSMVPPLYKRLPSIIAPRKHLKGLRLLQIHYNVCAGDWYDHG